MGLDTTHDCWHGPYGMFHAWRQAIHRLICAQNKRERLQLEHAWADGMYIDQTQPLNVLMNHSDCDGIIPAAMCAPLADALENLVQDIKPSAYIDDYFLDKTRRFVDGLRYAASLNEDVEFH